MSIEGSPGPDFLKQKYDLHNSPEVESAAKRTERRTGETLPQDTDSRIQNYLDRFKEITDRKNPEERERLLSALKNILHDKFVIKVEEIPEAYFENQQRMARELGHGDVEIGQEQRNQLTEVILADQESSLDNWTDYLTSDDATYPDWLKYFAMRSVTQMGGFDKERHAFSKRSKGTTKPFPDLNREALAYVLDAMEKKYEDRSIDSLEGEEKEQFEKLLTSENFAKLYAWAIEKVTPASVEQITITDGQWVKYDQNSDHLPLVQSLQGHGTGWCTAGESTAKTQLEGGDFYVFYSHDQEGKSTIPRVAIRMQGDQIGEVRGIASEQNLDPYINNVVSRKLEEFPDGKTYEKKVDNMRFLTGIERKVKAGQELNKDDLIFLYEINSKIEGFGYQRDPRIEELRKERNPKADTPIVMECFPEEIAWSQSEISENTKAYVGPLFPGIFVKLSNFEHIYTSFPEGKIRRSELEIGGKSAQELEQELKENKINISPYAQDMLDKMFQSEEFKTLQSNSETIDLVRLKVRDLGFTQNPTTDQIYATAEELGLELCPAEVGPRQRLEDTDQSLGDWYRIQLGESYE
ncbi:MAG: hypothetical protein US31_C0014G0027 [Berkelbacteria bacterium GW2011_GWA1_36_9]|uniref:Uncharacterized protein n=1 Tax=Berkelbacteria bacterium GW2011_GWA1_36_9 TaxID=1618331 RepID=A0A0G0IPE4_9BACT|nr:MAG: hypothetical protein US31_C0014G0027 [Berkelbacteria bacterium GW2011_GWA1_36_9]